MTTIFADAKKGVMVCDSKATCGDSWFAVTKVFRVGDQLIGFAGAYSEGTRWLDWYANGQRGKMPGIGGVTPIVLSAEGVCVIESSDRAVTIERGFHAVGSGATAALGAYMAGADARKAVAIACDIDAGSGGKIHIHKLRG